MGKSSCAVVMMLIVVLWSTATSAPSRKLLKADSNVSVRNVAAATGNIAKNAVHVTKHDVFSTVFDATGKESTNNQNGFNEASFNDANANAIGNIGGGSTFLNTVKNAGRFPFIAPGNVAAGRTVGGTQGTSSIFGSDERILDNGGDGDDLTSLDIGGLD